ncbi:Zn(2)-Cys(6) zinc finger domain protein [Phialemonium atrogriseum]|uniref:Zn(2)-Cys(6) zinc finger domain protein n=1 Tax=Phialemonium atrogriseum TaxID=1093897 RepID=A0AAJ0C076_9PEZI|nr:Zn(2)-Cys(6) zinc finger domain protein [Phialemonium atrogriseum]KAK1767545.1 Zn(2)-Cys(6) zinc finger domain protein [Phialemonium atrogriseum]
MEPQAATQRTASEAHAAKRLRLACDSCHGSKVRCSGGDPCARCRDGNLECQYSYMSRLGKPKGSRNKKTLEKLAATAPGAAVPHAHTGSLDPYPALSDEIQLSSHSGTFDVSRGSEAYALPGWMDADLMGFSGTLDAVWPEERSLNMHSSQRGLLSQPTEKLPWGMSGPQKDQSSAVAANTTTTHDTMLSVSEDSEGDDQRICSTAEWRGFVPRSAPDGKRPWEDPTETDTTDTLVATGRSPASASNEVGEMGCCSCLKRLTDHLCHLNTIERKQDIICLDTTLSKTDTTLSCAESVLECHHCRLDSKVVLLIMTVLQTALNWLSVEYRHGTYARRRLPPIHFGSWRVPEADGDLIKKLLTSRILATSDSVASTLRLRMDEITLKASKQNMSSRFMDAESLQQTLQRLTSSLRELAEHVKS